MKDRIHLLLKFGSKKNIEDLYKNGTVYLNTLEYFQFQENNSYRGDPQEATVHIKNFQNPENYTLTFTDTKTGKSFSKKPGELFLSDKSLSPGNLYSLYGIKHSDFVDGIFRVDPKVKEFGSHFLVISNPAQFMERLKFKIKESGMEFQAQAVEYYDKWKHNGSLTLFHKTLEYKYQNEYRVLVNNKTDKPIKFSLGSLEDISQILETDRIQHLQFTMNLGK